MESVVDIGPWTTRDDAEELSWFCQDMFSSLPRSDQRRWAEVYVRGLISVPGRKSIRRIAEQIVGWRADQCLQQFVNQSPWNWQAVRHGLAQHLSAVSQPKVWVVDEAVFPKNGASSVAVAKQYSQTAKRTLNCQLALAVSLVGEGINVPVNWRLMLPRCWDGDEYRRSRTHVPDDERHRTRWEYLLDALDEMTGQWELTPAPVVIDATQEYEVGSLLRGLEQRALPYVVRVSPDMSDASITGPGLERGLGEQSVGQIAMRPVRSDRITLAWRDKSNQQIVRSRFIATGLRETASTPARRLLAEWTYSSAWPSRVWVSNMSTARLPDLVGTVKLGIWAGDGLRPLRDGVGLRHFEGRSYQGWHHHVTLASVAHAYATLRAAERRRDEASVASDVYA